MYVSVFFLLQSCFVRPGHLLLKHDVNVNWGYETSIAKNCIFYDGPYGVAEWYVCML